MADTYFRLLIASLLIVGGLVLAGLTYRGGAK